MKYDLGTGFLLEVHLPLMLEKLGVNCVFDVGANVGQYGKMLRKIGYRDLILSFEPVSSAYFELEKAANGDKLWRTYPMALGAECGKKEINVSARSDLNSFRKPSALYRKCFSEPVEKAEEVSIRTLDSLFGELTIGKRDLRPFLKLDTQGFDLEVIAGAKDSLGKFLGLQSELSVKPLYEGSPSYLDALRIYSDLGFSLKNIYSIFASEDHSTAIELDCLMVRS
jgi:FkbM family methyltransferase